MSNIHYCSHAGGCAAVVVVVEGNHYWSSPDKKGAQEVEAEEDSRTPAEEAAVGSLLVADYTLKMI